MQEKYKTENNRASVCYEITSSNLIEVDGVMMGKKNDGRLFILKTLFPKTMTKT